MPRVIIGIALFLFLTGPAFAQTIEQRLKKVEDQMIELRLMRESLAEQTASQTRLQDQIAQLTGAIEQLRYQIEELKKLTSLEARLNTLEKKLAQQPETKVAEPTQVSPPENSAVTPVPAETPPAKTADTALTAPEQTAAKTETQTQPTDITKPQKPLSEKETFEQAKSYFKQGSMVKARKAMQDFITEFPASAIVASAKFWIGETYYYEKKFEEAILEYQKVIRDHPKADKVPSALLKQAYAFAELKDPTSARLILKRLIKEYSKTPQADIARKKLKLLD